MWEVIERDATCVSPACGECNSYPNPTFDSCLSPLPLHPCPPTTAPSQQTTSVLTKSDQTTKSSLILLFPSIPYSFISKYSQLSFKQWPKPITSVSSTATTISQATFISDLDDYVNLLTGLSASILEPLFCPIQRVKLTLINHKMDQVIFLLFTLQWIQYLE